MMTEDRVYNFSAGPSILPEEVLQRAKTEIMNYHGSGMSVMEMSHRSKAYEEIITACKATMREVMDIPEEYDILLLQGGASSQFAMVPLNLMTTGAADYAVTGQFSKKAWKEAARYGDARLAASSEDRNNTYIPAQDALKLSDDASYLHICFNNTIYGTKFNYIPDTGSIPLVADMSSCIISEPVDVTKFGVIYAGAQKNMAPAGLTVVIVREDLLGWTNPATPSMLDWQLMADNGSMYNTPPCYAIYMAGLVYEWIKSIGGLAEMKKRNEAKAALLYDYLDSQDYYIAPVEKASRSMMNVTFVTGNPDLDAKFAKDAAAEGLKNLKGHRSVGGMRASIYNAMPYEGVEKLVAFMKRFASENAK
jgi:phosphoserine aminotransferase